MTNDILIAQMQYINRLIKRQEALIERLATSGSSDALREKAEEHLDDLNDQFIALVNEATAMTKNASSI